MTIASRARRRASRAQAVEELSHRRDEPDWLREQAPAAWEVYEQTPMPKRTDEEWRRTDIRTLPLDDVPPFGDARQPRQRAAPSCQERARAEIEAAGPSRASSCKSIRATHLLRGEP